MVNSIRLGSLLNRLTQSQQGVIGFNRAAEPESLLFRKEKPRENVFTRQMIYEFFDLATASNNHQQRAADGEKAQGPGFGNRSQVFTE